jgi:hypothetical protein
MSTQITITNPTELAGVAKALREARKAKLSGGGLFYEGALTDPDGGRRYEFEGALQCFEVKPQSNPADSVFSVFIGVQTWWDVQPQGGVFTILAEGEVMANHYPITPERAKALWPEWVEVIDEEPVKATKATKTTSAPKTTTTTPVINAQAKGYSTKIVEPANVVAARQKIHSFSQVLGTLKEDDGLYVQLSQSLVDAKNELDAALAAWEVEKVEAAAKAKADAEAAAQKAEYERRVDGAKARQAAVIADLEAGITELRKQMEDDEEADVMALRAQIKVLRQNILEAQTELDDLPALVAKQLAEEAQARIDAENAATAALAALEAELAANALRRSIEDAIELLRNNGYEVNGIDMTSYPVEADLGEPMVEAMVAAVEQPIVTDEQLAEVLVASDTLLANAQERSNKRHSNRR